MIYTPRLDESQAVSRRPRLTLSTMLLVGSLAGATAASAASFYSLTDLGTLGGCGSAAAAINASGQVAGEAQTPSGETHAFLYDGTTMRDLNDLLDASRAGWTVVDARDMNDAGQIAARASRPYSCDHAVLLTPWSAVTIDIKPGGFPNSINPQSKGKIPVAILSSPTFDAPAQVDQGSVTFGRTGDEPSLASCSSGPEDVNGDGWPDLVCQFHTPTAAFQAGDTEGVLKGKTVAAIPFSGSDSVRIVPK